MTRIARTLILLILISGTPIIHCAEDTEYKDNSKYYPPIASKNAIQGYLPNPHTTYRQQTNNTDDEAVSTEKQESELADLKQDTNYNKSSKNYPPLGGNIYRNDDATNVISNPKFKDHESMNHLKYMHLYCARNRVLKDRDGRKYFSGIATGRTMINGKYFLKNGEYVKTSFRQNKFNGPGICFSSSDAILFSGYFENGKQNGHGISWSSKSGKQLKIYDGNWSSGKWSGFGTLFFDTGKPHYRGQWRNDKFHGQGVLFSRHSGNWMYNGNWADGEFTGEGKKRYGTTSYTKGMFVDGKENGYNVRYKLDTDQVLFKGYYKNGKANGKGILYLYKISGKVLYDGDWKNGQKNGSGILYYEDGANLKRYGGEWKDGCRHGEGTDYGRDQRNYTIGTWYNNKLNGNGSQYVDGHLSYKGEFKNTKKNGQGILYFPTAKTVKIYEGGWKDGERHGQGTCYFGESQRVQNVGTWRMGKAHGWFKFYEDSDEHLLDTEGLILEDDEPLAAENN
eukprot:531604_1